MSSGKKKLIIFFLFFMVLAIPASVYVVLQQQQLESQAEPATTLSFDPSGPIGKTVGDTFSLNININTGTNSVTGVELHIQYDTSKLMPVGIDVAPNPFLPVVAQNGTWQNGFAFIALSQPSQPKKGIGTLAVLTMEALAPTAGGSPTLIQFTPDTRIAGVTGQTTEPGNILASQPQPAAIIINTPNPTATPTIVDTCTPSDCSVCAVGASCKQDPGVPKKACSCQFPTTPTPIGGGGFGSGITITPTGNIGIGGTKPTSKPTIATASATLKAASLSAVPTKTGLPVSGDLAPTTILTIGGAILTLVGVVSLLAF